MSPDSPIVTKSEIDFGELRKAAMDATFNPDYRVSRCGQQSAHGPHVVESGPDQPRNCPGGPAWSWSFVPIPAAVPAVPSETPGANNA